MGTLIPEASRLCLIAAGILCKSHTRLLFLRAPFPAPQLPWVWLPDDCRESKPDAFGKGATRRIECNTEIPIWRTLWVLVCFLLQENRGNLCIPLQILDTATL